MGEVDYGKGHYYIKNDSLIFDYDLTVIKEDSYHKSKAYKNYKDSVTVMFKIHKQSGEIIKSVSVIGDLEKGIGTGVDMNGVAYLKFKKEKKQQEINVSDLCCGNYKFYINTNMNYEIEVFMRNRFNNSQAIKNHISKYKIQKLSKKEIKLNVGSGLLVLKREN